MNQIYDYWTMELQKNGCYKDLISENPDLVRSFVEDGEIRKNFTNDLSAVLINYFEKEESYQNIINKINVMLNPQYCLSYYCNIDTAVSLLSKTQFWLCNTEHMNDYGEIDYGLNCLRKVIRQNEHNISDIGEILQRSGKEFLKSFDEIFSSLKNRTFLMSFSNQSIVDKWGRLSMWNRYGNSGVSIIFDRKAIEILSRYVGGPLSQQNLSMCKLNNVIYDDNPVKLIDTTVKNCLNYIKEHKRDYIMSSNIKDIYYHEWMYCLLHGICILKHPVFSEEAEARLFITCQESLDELEKNDIITVEKELVKGQKEDVVKIDFGKFVNANEFNLSWNDVIKRIVIWNDREEDANRKKGKIVEAICNGKMDNAIVEKIEILDMPYRDEKKMGCIQKNTINITSRKIYDQLQDDMSKNIFLCRCAYSLSDDINVLLPMLKQNSESHPLYGLELGDKDYIFGCGYYGNMLMKSIKHSWCGFIDNNSELWGKEINNIPVFSPDNIGKEARIFIANRYHHSAIYAQLKEMGFNDNQLINVGNMIEAMASKQYFDLQEMPHSTKEVFVDIGALNGDTSKLFINWCQGNFEHIYCFEPDERNIDKCKSNLITELDNGKVTLIPKGVWDKTERMNFIQQANGTSMIGDDGETSIDTITMDEALTGKNVTFIKMDIEGAEYKALQAAEKIIKNDKPKLAISVYHCPEDIIRIPELILGFNSDYRLYLRHYSPFENETILYAI